MVRRKIAAGNWKMNTTFSEAIALADDITHGTRDADVHTILAVPFPYINKVKSIIDETSGIRVAAQNCHHMPSGAYTGEVSAAMLASLDVPFVIIGHSERREYQGEDSAILLAKTKLAIENDLQVIFCCGEPLHIRKAGQEVSYVIDQLVHTIFQLEQEAFEKIIIAYEPIWAIGTGETATDQQAQDMHLAIRRSIDEHMGKALALSTSILYGGSVKGTNAKSLFAMPDVDGGLVGGASLKAEEFLTIINSF